MRNLGELGRIHYISLETHQLLEDGLRHQNTTWDPGPLRQRLRSQLETLDWRVYPSRIGGWSCKTTQELKLQEGRQVGWEYPPAGLLVSQKGTGFPAVVGLLIMFLMKPTEARRSWRSGRWSWSQRTLGERDLHGVGNLRSPSAG